MAARSLNGTATNDSSTQTNNQREGYSGSTTGTLGASRTDMGKLFDLTASGRGSGIEVNLRAKEILGLNYGTTPQTQGFTFADDGVDVGKNPDFPGGHQASNYRYKTGMGAFKFSEVGNMKDKPNIFGPNISTIDIKNPNANAANTSSSPTANRKQQANLPPNEQDENGYGTEIKSNDPRFKSTANKPFFMKRNPGEREVLGEYIKTNTYDYES